MQGRKEGGEGRVVERAGRAVGGEGREGAWGRHELPWYPVVRVEWRGLAQGSKPAEGCNHPPPGRGGWYPGPRTDQYLKHREVSSRYFRCPNVAGNEGVKNIYVYIERERETRIRKRNERVEDRVRPLFEIAVDGV